MSKHFLASTYKLIADYYSEKVVKAKREVQHYLLLEMYYLQEGFIDIETSNKIINLDKQITHYEIEIKRNVTNRDWLIRFKNIDKEENIFGTSDVCSRIQSDILKKAEDSVDKHTGVSVNWGKVFQFVSGFNENNGSSTVAKSGA